MRIWRAARTKQKGKLTVTVEVEQSQSAIPHEAIAVRAYELFCGRGCEDGHELEDWFQAEAELREDALAAAPQPSAAATSKKQ